MKILSRKKILSEKLFDIIEETLEYQNGRSSTHRNVYRKTAVSIFPLTDTNKLCLIKQYRYMLNTTILEAPAGFREEGESALKTAQRELREETGIIAKKWKELLTVDAAGSVVVWQQPLFLAQELTFEKDQKEDGEEISLVKIPLEEGVERILSGEIKTASSIIGILLLNEMKKRGELG